MTQEYIESEGPSANRDTSETTLRWSAALGDSKLDRRLRNAAQKLQWKHPSSLLDAEDVAQRMRLRLARGAVTFRAENGMAPEALLRFKSGNLAWDKYASVIITNECRRYAGRMAREAAEAHLHISRDGRNEIDENGDKTHWRDALDFRTAQDGRARETRKADIEEAIGCLSGRSRQILEACYRLGLSQREMAQRFGMSLASFQRGPWAQAKADFIRFFGSGAC